MLMIIFYLEATKREEISRIIPLFSLSPLFILIVAHFFLREVLTIWQYIGIFLLVGGSISISLEKFDRFRITTASILMIFSALAWAFHQLITDYLVRFNDFWTVFSYARMGAFLVILPELIYYFRSIKKLFRKKGPRPFILLGLSEGFYLVGIALSIIATSIGLVTLVNGILSIQPFIVFLLSIFLSLFLPKIIKEKIDKSTLTIKFIAIFCMIVGTIFVS